MKAISASFLNLFASSILACVRQILSELDLSKYEFVPFFLDLAVERGSWDGSKESSDSVSFCCFLFTWLEGFAIFCGDSRDSALYNYSFFCSSLIFGQHGACKRRYSCCAGFDTSVHRSRFPKRLFDAGMVSSTRQVFLGIIATRVLQGCR